MGKKISALPLSAKMRNLGLKTLLILVLALLAPSCMMMGPGHLMVDQHGNNNHMNEAGYVDPVCGNTIEQVTETLSYNYGGSTHYFHSQDCMNNFKASPQKYLPTQQGQHRSPNAFLWGMGGVAMGALMIFMVL